MSYKTWPVTYYKPNYRSRLRLWNHTFTWPEYNDLTGLSQFAYQYIMSSHLLAACAVCGVLIFLNVPVITCGLFPSLTCSWEKATLRLTFSFRDFVCLPTCCQQNSCYQKSQAKSKEKHNCNVQLFLPGGKNRLEGHFGWNEFLIIIDDCIWSSKLKVTISSS